MSRNDRREAGRHENPDEGSSTEWTLPDLLALRLPEDAAARAAMRASLTSQWTGEIPVLRDLDRPASAAAGSEGTDEDPPRRRGRHALPDDAPLITQDPTPVDGVLSTALATSGTAVDAPVDGAVAPGSARAPRPHSVAASALLAGSAPSGRRRARRLAEVDEHTVPFARVVELPADPTVELPAAPTVELPAEPKIEPPVEATEASPEPNPPPTDVDEQPVRPANAGRGRINLGAFGKPAVVAGTAVICLLTAAGGTVAALDKDVTISVDGEARQISTLAGDVAGALASAGLTIGEHDALAPAPSAAIQDGSKISLDRAREITVVVDGQSRTIWSTARTVEEELGELGDSEARLKLSADRSRAIPLKGIDITAANERSVSLTVAGVPTKELTTAATVADLLAQEKVVVDAHDVVKPAATSPITDGMAVEVVKREVQRSSEKRPVAQPADRTISDPAVRRHTTTVTEGRAGVEELIHQVVTTNGEKGERTLVSRKVLTPAEATTTHIGTKIVEPQDAWNVPWDQMAQCESTGRWDIDTGNGTYGGLQFMTSTWLAIGGGEFAERADLATKEQQIEIAERLYAQQGLAPWHCARLLGWGFDQYAGGW